MKQESNTSKKIRTYISEMMVVHRFAMVIREGLKSLSQTITVQDIGKKVDRLSSLLQQFSKEEQKKREEPKRVFEELRSKIQPIVEENDKVRLSAYFYRRLYKALKLALHDRLSHNPHEFAIYDEIIAAAQIYERDEAMSDDEAMKAVAESLRKEMFKEEKKGTTNE